MNRRAADGNGNYRPVPDLPSQSLKKVRRINAIGAIPNRAAPAGRNRRGARFAALRVSIRAMARRLIRFAPRSALEQRIDLFRQFLDRQRAAQLLAIDEQGWRRFDAELLGGAVLLGLQAVEELLISQAGVEAL